MNRFLIAVAAGVAVMAAGSTLLAGVLGTQAAGVVAYLVALPTFLALVGGAKALRSYADGQEPPEGRGWQRYFSYDVDHKVVGVQYGVASLIVFLFGGIMALLMRLELARHGLQFFTPQQYNTAMSLHGIAMVVVALIGTAGSFGNFIVPLQLGARDMAFPRLNALSFWLLPPAVLLLLATPFAGGLDFGWAAYAPLSVQGAGLGKMMFILAFITVGFSSIFSGVNFLATALTMRAQGMTWLKVPIFTWAILSAAIIQLMGTSVVASSLIMVTFDRVLHTTFFNPALGGNVLLYQHLFWYYSHPAVYIMVLPGFGTLLEIIPTFSRKPLFAYPLAVAAFIAIVILGFVVWAHHMFTSGMWALLKMPFMINTELISIPTGVVFLAALGTLWRAKIRLDSPMVWAMAVISNVLIGGLTGIPLADAPTDFHLHDTWFVVAHFHFTIMGGAIFGTFAAFHYWFPKMTGKRLNETLAKVQCGLMFFGFNALFVPLFWLGNHGMRRRVADFPAWMDPIQTWSSLMSLVVGASVLVFAYNVYRSLKDGEAAGDNPWEAKTLEWKAPSPPPHGNFKTPPVVTEHPYDYGVSA
ncbi:MAG: cbb3-type cytochrome c oxidase subunit I [Elusimicrobia bacterium]|nr:cbb3-type cytochrome c oxidase subunit I [Elusimicrobiota bacterium]